MKKRITALVCCFALLLACGIQAFASNSVPAPSDWRADEVFTSTDTIALTCGDNDGDINFSWVTAKLYVNEEFIYGRAEDLSDAEAAEVNSINEASFIFTVNRVALCDLEPGTYYYNYTVYGEWQGIKSFKINDETDGFSAIFVSDPQVGRSGDDSEQAILDDAYGWARTLDTATAKTDASFVMCAGDQVNVAIDLREYNAFLYPEALRSIPVMAAVGNHDFYSDLFACRFYNPNVADDVLSTAGNDYFFARGNALFVVLNSNNFLIEDHRAALNAAVSAYPDAKWRVVMMHHSVYFSGSDDDIVANIFTPMFDEFDIDLVLSGHEHTYSRTEPLTAGKSDPDGVTYLATTTASGCNYDNYENNDERIVNAKHLEEPAYSVLDFSENAIKVSSYTTDTDELFDEFTIEKAAASEKENTYSAPRWYLHIVEMVKMILDIIRKAVPAEFIIIK